MKTSVVENILGVRIERLGHGTADRGMRSERFADNLPREFERARIFFI